MLNHVVLLGRLAQDPEIKSTTGGKLVASFDLAVQVPGKDRDTPPDYIPITCWERNAEYAQLWLCKGFQIVVEGRISTRKWTDRDGKSRKAVEVIASRLYFAGSNNGAGNANAAKNDGYAEPDPFDELLNMGNDDGLPF